MTQKKGGGKRQFCTMPRCSAERGLCPIRDRENQCCILAKLRSRSRRTVIGRCESNLLCQFVEERAACPGVFLWSSMKKQNPL